MPNCVHFGTKWSGAFSGRSWLIRDVTQTQTEENVVAAPLNRPDGDYRFDASLSSNAIARAASFDMPTVRSPTCWPWYFVT